MFLDQDNLRNSVADLSAAGSEPAYQSMALYGLPIFHCPSRRSALAYPDAAP